MKIKKDIKKILEKLRKNGIAFDHIKYENKRSLKINNILEEGLIGTTISPCLKNNIYLHLEFYFDNLYIYKTTPEKKLIHTITDWRNEQTKIFTRIPWEYEKHFYEIGELLEIFNNRKDLKDIHLLLNTIYPELKIRHYENNKNNIILYAGSGIFTFKIEKYTIYKKLIVSIYFYGSGSKKYQRGNIYTLSKNWRNIIKNNYNIQEIYDLNLNKYKNFYLKCRKINTV